VTPGTSDQPPQITILDKPVAGGARQFNTSLRTYDSQGNPVKYYTFSFKLIKVGLKVKEQPISLILKPGDKVRVLQKLGVWKQDRERMMDASTASAALEVTLTVPTWDKPQLELSVQDIDVRRAYKDNTLVVTSSLHFVLDAVVGKESHRTLTENDNGVPKRWIEFTLDEGVPVRGGNEK
jgi:hypothetical protein